MAPDIAEAQAHVLLVKAVSAAKASTELVEEKPAVDEG